MTSDQIDEADIFNAARKLHSPAERAEYLERACSDPELRAHIARMLRAYDEQPSYLAAPACELAATSGPASAERPGTLIGPYKLLEQIGEGGMGLVYMAEQQQPVRRLVALKIIRPGMDSKQVIARFEAERQALALMDHPNIAKVLDAGTVGAGKDEGGRVKDEVGSSSGSSVIPHPSSFH